LDLTGVTRVERLDADLLLNPEALRRLVFTGMAAPMDSLAEGADRCAVQ
jgi:hypothetical protein